MSRLGALVAAYLGACFIGNVFAAVMVYRPAGGYWYAWQHRERFQALRRLSWQRAELVGEIRLAENGFRAGRAGAGRRLAALTLALTDLDAMIDAELDELAHRAGDQLDTATQ